MAAGQNETYRRMGILLATILIPGLIALCGVIGAAAAPGLFGVAAIALGPVAAACAVGGAIITPLVVAYTFFDPMLQTKHPAINYTLGAVVSALGLLSPFIGALVLGLSINLLLPVFFAEAAITGMILAAAIVIVLIAVVCKVVYDLKTKGMAIEVPVSVSQAPAAGLPNESTMAAMEAPRPVASSKGADFFHNASKDALPAGFSGLSQRF